MKAETMTNLTPDETNQRHLKELTALDDYFAGFETLATPEPD